MTTTEAIEMASRVIVLKMGSDKGQHCVCVVSKTLICVRPLMVPSDAAVIMKLSAREMKDGLTSSQWNVLDAKLRTLVKGGLL